MLKQNRYRCAFKKYDIQNRSQANRSDTSAKIFATIKIGIKSQSILCSYHRCAFVTIIFWKKKINAQSKSISVYVQKIRHIKSITSKQVKHEHQDLYYEQKWNYKLIDFMQLSLVHIRNYYFRGRRK